MSAAFAPPASASLVETQIRIAAPLATIWSILTAFEDYGSWNDYIRRIDGMAAAGAAIVAHSRDAASGHMTEQAIRIAALSPHSMHWVGGAADLAEFRGDHFFELVPVAADITDFLHREYFSGRLAGAILAQFAPAILRNFETFNACLQRCAEQRPPQPLPASSA